MSRDSGNICGLTNDFYKGITNGKLSPALQFLSVCVDPSHFLLCTVKSLRITTSAGGYREISDSMADGNGSKNMSYVVLLEER